MILPQVQSLIDELKSIPRPVGISNSRDHNRLIEISFREYELKGWLSALEICVNYITLEYDSEMIEDVEETIAAIKGALK